MATAFSADVLPTNITPVGPITITISDPDSEDLTHEF
jgi:hypothetical protein